jgi:hypothetical protein
MRLAVLAWLVAIATLVACGDARTPEPSGSDAVFPGEATPEPVDRDGDGIVGETDEVPFVADDPPDATISGVAGHPVSWCWGNACVDGFVTIAGADQLPGVSDPSFVQVPMGTRVESAQVWRPGGQEDSLNIPFEGLTLEPIPHGAVILFVSIRGESGGDVTYAWHVVSPQSSG